MKLLFALLTCSAAFPQFRGADTGGGNGSPAALPEDAPTADPSIAIHGTEGSGVSTPAVDQTPEPPAPKGPFMPDDVKAAIIDLIVDTVGKLEARKLEEAAAAAQAPQPHGGHNSAAAAVEARFQSVPLDGDKREMVQLINGAAKALALAVEEFVPAGKEKDFAHGAIMQAAMFANSAISRS